MTVAVTIGAYRLVDFVALCVLRWRRLIKDVPILISDDKAAESSRIKDIADTHGCDYVCSEKRRGHFAADMQTFINGLIFGRELGVDIAIKCSQRVIPVLPGLIDPMLRAFSDPECQIVLPGRINKNQISRPAAKFYGRFGILTDLVAMRVGCIDPDELLRVYRERNSNGKASDSFSETTFGWLLDKRFAGNKHRILAEWTNHRQNQPKLYLRKSQSSSSDFCQVAAMEGLSTDHSRYPLAEWREIESGGRYKPKADLV